MQGTDGHDEQELLNKRCYMEETGDGVIAPSRKKTQQRSRETRNWQKQRCNSALNENASVLKVRQHLLALLH